jgi:hypothetical protein
VSKLGKMQCQNADALAKDVKADDLRQMFLAMTEEVRHLLLITYSLVAGAGDNREACRSTSQHEDFVSHACSQTGL